MIDYIEIWNLGKKFPIFLKQNPVIKSQIEVQTAWLPINSTSRQRLWHLINNINCIPKCKQCNEFPVKWNIKSNSYRDFCSVKCFSNNPDVRNKTIQTNLKKYGYETNLRSEKIKQKIKQTNIKKYGVDNPSKNLDVKTKITDSHQTKYGKTRQSQHHISNDILSKVDDYLWFKDQYVNKKKSLTQISKETGVSVTQIAKRAEKFNINIVWGRSSYENEIGEFIKSIYSGPIEFNSKKIISPKQLDIFLPEKNIAIEFNGLYWHSEKYKSNENYHAEKFFLCDELNINLIQIWQSEWENHKEAVKSKISKTLGLNKVVHGKKSIEQIDLLMVNDFLLKNSTGILYNKKNRYLFGLFVERNLLSVFSLHSLKNESYYLIENISDKNFTDMESSYNFVLSKIIDIIKPTCLFFKHDLKWGRNNFIENLNFQKDSYQKPMAWYTNDFSKLLKSPSMKHKKYYKIWDCGYFLYKKDFGIITQTK